MAHLKKEQLYSLYHSLQRHHDGDSPIDGLEIDKALTKVLRKLSRERGPLQPKLDRPLHPGQIKRILAHTKECQKCQILVYEDGPYATRPKSEEEKMAEEVAEQVELRRLSRKFFISTGVGVASFIGANVSIVKYRKIVRDSIPDTGPMVGNPNRGIEIHPLQLLFFALIVVAAFTLAEAWRIGNLLWLDWTRAKEAVPVIGKRWAARSRRKKERLKLQSTNTQSPDLTDTEGKPHTGGDRQ